MNQFRRSNISMKFWEGRTERKGEENLKESSLYKIEIISMWLSYIGLGHTILIHGEQIIFSLTSNY